MKHIEHGVVIVLLASCRVGGEHKSPGDEATVGKDLSPQEALYMINGKQAKVKADDEKATTPNDDPNEPPALEDMNKKQLQAVAKELEIEGYKSMTKEQLVEAIQAQDEAEEDNDPAEG